MAKVDRAQNSETKVQIVEQLRDCARTVLFHFASSPTSQAATETGQRDDVAAARPTASYCYVTDACCDGTGRAHAHGSNTTPLPALTSTSDRCERNVAELCEQLDTARRLDELAQWLDRVEGNAAICASRPNAPLACSMRIALVA